MAGHPRLPHSLRLSARGRPLHARPRPALGPTPPLPIPPSRADSRTLLAIMIELQQFNIIGQRIMINGMEAVTEAVQDLKRCFLRQARGMEGRGQAGRALMPCGVQVACTHWPRRPALPCAAAAVPSLEPHAPALAAASLHPRSRLCPPCPAHHHAGRRWRRRTARHRAAAQREDLRAGVPQQHVGK